MITSFEFSFEDYMPQNMIIKYTPNYYHEKRCDAFNFSHEFKLCFRNIMFLKQLTISAERRVNYLLVIGQYVAVLRISLLMTVILKIQRVEMQVRLTKMWSAEVKLWGSISIPANAQPPGARVTLLGHMLLGWRFRSWLAIFNFVSSTIFFYPPTTISLIQSAGAVEYTDCFSVEG